MFFDRFFVLLNLLPVELDIVFDFLPQFDHLLLLLFVEISFFTRCLDPPEGSSSHPDGPHAPAPAPHAAPQVPQLRHGANLSENRSKSETIHV
ncbi:hypothetical protein TcasGA2_TC034810 [Tribolium castaneum]|uniref:Uncharacterized protein n=1 Tax=Tribolium castaneum TaxID=7070 RepID=A0A139WF07_TRICA|nr:hypothetical protein TcasGA2_TC034810 [Tribolium castaneum]